MMKKKLIAGFMAATMMVSVMTTGVFAKDLDPTDETQRSGDTTVTATVEENPNKADYIIRIPETVDFGKIQQPETEGDAYSYKDITVECVKAENLEAGTEIAVLVKDATANGNTENEQENHSEEEEHLQDKRTTNAKTGDESKATMWITIVIFSMLVFGCGIKYKKGNK